MTGERVDAPENALHSTMPNRRSRVRIKGNGMNYEAGKSPIPLPQSETSVLSHFDRARRELELAVSIDEVKSIRDKAEALRLYAKQSRLSLEMQNHCAEIRIRAERRAGDMLKEMEKHPPGPIAMKDRCHDATDLPPRLVELGISKSQSSRWQALATIPDEDFEERVESLKADGRELTSSEMLSYAGFLRRERERRERKEGAFREAEQVQPDERIRIIHGDFREVLTEDVVPTGSVSLVLTDLPYGHEHLDLWDSLGPLSKRILKAGGILATYSGCAHLPDVLNLLSKHLTYCWTAALLNESFADTIFHPIRVKSLWKPILLFSKGHPEPSANENPSLRYLKDVIRGDGLGSLNKQDHPWQQGVGESAYLVEVLSLPGDMVVDPCCGSGTVPVACKRLNRRFIGCDIDQNAVDTALSRLAREPDPNEL